MDEHLVGFLIKLVLLGFSGFTFIMTIDSILNSYEEKKWREWALRRRK